MSARAILSGDDDAAEKRAPWRGERALAFAGPAFLVGDDALTRRGKRRDGIDRHSRPPLQEYLAVDARWAVSPAQAMEQKWQRVLQKVQVAARAALTAVHTTRRAQNRPKEAQG